MKQKIGWAKTRRDNSVIYGNNSVLTIVEAKVTTMNGNEVHGQYEIWLPLIAQKNDSVITEVDEHFQVFVQSWIIQAKEEQLAVKEGLKLVEILVENNEEEENDDERRPGIADDAADPWPDESH